MTSSFLEDHVKPVYRQAIEFYTRQAGVVSLSSFRRAGEMSFSDALSRLAVHLWLISLSELRTRTADVPTRAYLDSLIPTVEACRLSPVVDKCAADLAEGFEQRSTSLHRSVGGEPTLGLVRYIDTLVEFLAKRDPIGKARG